MQAECANRAASAAMESFSEDTAWTDLLSVEDAAEAVAAITDATQLALQGCITDIYLMGIEDGRFLRTRGLLKSAGMRPIGDSHFSN